jgi:hypothetical protein
MSHPPNEEYTTARRFQLFDTENPATAGPRFDAGYECELPSGVRTELVGAPQNGRAFSGLLNRLHANPQPKGGFCWERFSPS